jgi:acetoin utilization protein AcuB
MTPRPITIRKSDSVDEGLRLMREKQIRRLPVIDKSGKLVGIVSRQDLLRVSPSPATSLSIYEIPYLLSKIKIEDVMTEDVVTVTVDTPLEDAARIMADSRIGGLPVTKDGKLVGIITETDMFKLFLELFGARECGVRISMLVPEGKGMLAKITGRIAEIGGNILALGTMMGEDPTNREIAVRVADVSLEELTTAMEELGAKIKIKDSRVCEY